MRIFVMVGSITTCTPRGARRLLAQAMLRHALRYGLCVDPQLPHLMHAGHQRMRDDQARRKLAAKCGEAQRWQQCGPGPGRKNGTAGDLRGRPSVARLQPGA